MCGIIGYLGADSFQDYLLNGLTLLQNRGYDSVGISCIHTSNKTLDTSLHTIKHASSQTHDSLEELKNEVSSMDWSKNHLGIGHTRWATHGSKTRQNAHPHHDNNNRIALVHNGIIENYQELKTSLLAEGYFFRSQTDTEVVAVLIGQALDQGLSIDQAIQHTLSKISGTWAFLIIHKDYPNKLWLTRNGSPLLLGIQEDFAMVASEPIAFGQTIHQYIVLDNHDLIELSLETSSGQSLVQMRSINMDDLKKPYTKRSIESTEPIEYAPTGYQHWFMKEIAEQPAAISRAINHGGRLFGDAEVKLGGLETHREALLALDHLIVLGCGTSYHAGLWSLDLFKTMDLFDTVSIYDGADFGEKDIPRQGKTGLILLSQSGETKDLHRCIHIAKTRNLMTLGIVNVQDSWIARESDCGVYLNAGREVSVASTKSFTNQCVVLALVAVWFSQNNDTSLSKRRSILHDVRNLAYQAQIVLSEVKHLGHIDQIVEKLTRSPTKTMFLLGKGQEEAIAKEGGLKLKEVAYIHAEGYSTSALKHGPFALIEEGLPIIILDIGEQYRDKTANALQEVLCRGAYVVLITDAEHLYPQSNVVHIRIKQNDTFSGILANMVLQLLGYKMATNLGLNPDFPRNLAKVVSVE
jgi:glucosamine--fructose-6-phosphate aminotransferase (isomerizing)